MIANAEAQFHARPCRLKAVLLRLVVKAQFLADCNRIIEVKLFVEMFVLGIFAKSLNRVFDYGER